MYEHRHRLRRVVTLILLSLALASTGCAIARMREQIRTGLLVRGLHQEAFIKEWGMPLRAGTIAGEEGMQAGWSNGGGFFQKGRGTYEMWTYGPPRDIQLVFDGPRLVAWKTDRTVNELRARN